MNGEAIIAVSAAVTTLVQLAKWAGLPTRWAPLTVLLFAAIGVAIWAFSEGDLTRLSLFSYFAGWLAVSVGAAGIYGFTRSEADNVPRARRSSRELEIPGADPLTNVRRRES